MDRAREGEELAGVLVVAREEDHRPRHRMKDALDLAGGEGRAGHVHDDGAERGGAGELRAGEHYFCSPATASRMAL